MLPQTLSPQSSRIGWIGTGVMGASMCGHLLAAGYRVSVYNRTREKAEPLLSRGARWAEGPGEIAGESDAVFTMLGYPHDVQQVASEVLAELREGALLVEMTTSTPSLAVSLAKQARERGAWSLDAPVSGGDVGAREARLSIMIGGEALAVDAVRPALELLGTTIVHQGPAGAGQHTKMVNQTLIASGMIGVCEGLLYAYKAGLDLETVMRSVASGAAGSWSLSNLGPRIIAGDFAPGFIVEHFIKDMGIALEEACRMNLSLPGLALAEQLYVALAAQGHARSGTHALELALAKLSGFDWQSCR